MAILEQLKFRDLLAWIIIQCTKDETLIIGDESMNTIDSSDLEIKDKIISATIKLIDLAYFKNPTRNTEAIRQCNLFLYLILIFIAQRNLAVEVIQKPTPRKNTMQDGLFLSTISSNECLERRFFLKLFNHYFVRTMGKESFDTLLDLAKEQYSLLTNESHVLTLIVNRVWRLNSDIQEIFITNLNKLMEYPKNVITFINVPQSLEFIYSFLGEQVSGKLNF